MGEVSVHELYLLKAVVEGVLVGGGFELRTEKSHPDDFGSYYAVYGADDREVRFVWDGKEGCGLLEHRSFGSPGWTVLVDPIPEAAHDKMRAQAATEWAPVLAQFVAKRRPS